MGCCYILSYKSHFDKPLEKNVKETNKITTSKYFYERSKIKIKFSLISKSKIQVDIVKKNF